MPRICSIFLGIWFFAAACTSTTSGPNRPPVANAGPDGVALVGDNFPLDGRGSYDPDGDKINYQWEIAVFPAGASLDNVLSAGNSAQAVLKPSKAGLWLVKLTVSDGRLASTPDIVEVRAKPTCESDADCPDDGLFCNGAEYCNRENGCDHRGDPCTGQGACDEEHNLCTLCGDGVVSTSTGEQCDPGDPQKDHCCRTDNCHWVESGQLDPQNVCDSVDNECTDPDTCDGQGGCQPNHAQSGTACGDQDIVCHINDSCDGNGNCTDNGFVDNGTECGSPSCVGGQWLKQTCQGGECSGSEVIENCADNNECTQDLCSAASGCSHQPVTDDTPCTSNNTFCDGMEVCRAGQCISPGNPCLNPADCDEQNHRCGACGDGVVSTSIGEECDPGAPKNDHCCDPGTCKWVASGSVDPQNFCSGAPECQRDVCGNGGACTRVNKNNGTPCGDQSDTVCDNPDTCFNGTCQSNFEPNTTVCRSSAGDCDVAENCPGNGPSCPADTFQPSSYVCRSSAGDCDVAEYCPGNGPSCPADTFQPSSYVCRSSAGVCDVAEFCPGNGPSCPADSFQPSSYVCRAANGDCDVAENCTGSSASCPQDQYATSGTLCPGTDGNECNSTCDGAGNCIEAEQVPDLTPCNNSNGICCQDVCRTGWSCCAASDCDDNNQCTFNNCLFGTCDNSCSYSGCMKLGISSPVAVNTPAPLTIEMCPDNRDTGQFVCFSDRNQRVMVEEHFESNFGAFNLRNGSVTRQNSAQNPNTPGSWGVRICGDQSWMRVSLDTTGRSDIALVFSMANATLGDNQTLSANYSPNGGTNWRALAMVGDNKGPNKWQTFAFILPPEAENLANLLVSFYQTGGNAGSCAYVDDVYIIDLLPLTPVNPPLFQTNFNNLTGFNEQDPQNNDVELINQAGDTFVRITDHQNAYMELTNPLDTTGVNPYNLLIVEWEWRDTADQMDNPDDYARAEITLDGNNWIQLSTIGMSFAPHAFTTYRAILPCQALGTNVVKIGFIAPASAGNLADNEGIEITRLSIYQAQPAWVDWFAHFTDSGNGIYTSSVNSSTTGTANITCRYGCGATAIWSNGASVDFTP